MLSEKYSTMAQPAGGVVAGDGQGVSRDQHQQQQNNSQVQKRLCQGPEPLVVDLSDQQHGGYAHNGEHALADEVAHGIGSLGLIVGRGKTGGEQHDETDARQKHRQHQKRQVDGTPGQFPALLLHLPLVLPALLKRQRLFPAQGPAAGSCCHITPSSP